MGAPRLPMYIPLVSFTDTLLAISTWDIIDFISLEGVKWCSYHLIYNIFLISLIFLVPDLLSLTAAFFWCQLKLWSASQQLFAQFHSFHNCNSWQIFRVHLNAILTTVWIHQSTSSVVTWSFNIQSSLRKVFLI